MTRVSARPNGWWRTLNGKMFQTRPAAAVPFNPGGLGIVEERIDDEQGRAGGTPVSVHFVNNVLAAAAGYIELDPDQARDVLAELGAFLSHRLRASRTVGVAEELEHVAVYVRLEQARFPGRIEAELAVSAGQLADAALAPGDLQAQVAEGLERWLRERPGVVRMALRARPDGSGLDLQLDQPGAPGEAGERVRIALPGSMVAGRAA